MAAVICMYSFLIRETQELALHNFLIVKEVYIGLLGTKLL